VRRRFVRLFYLRQYAVLNGPPASVNESIALAAGLLSNVRPLPLACVHAALYETLVSAPAAVPRSAVHASSNVVCAPAVTGLGRPARRALSHRALAMRARSPLRQDAQRVC
jgi:hypothetical protein